jgi:hypothetical protein
VALLVGCGCGAPEYVRVWEGEEGWDGGFELAVRGIER